MNTGTGMVRIAGIYPDSSGERQPFREGVTPGRQQSVKMVLWQATRCVMMSENWVQLLPVTTTQHWKITSLEVYPSWTHLGWMCRKSDGKMQNICHPQQGHANTKVTVGVADSQDFAMFWQLICHKCHSSPPKTIAFLWGGGGDRRKSDFPDAETNMQLWVHADRNLGKQNHRGTYWTSSGCLICDYFGDVLHQEFLAVGGGNRAWLWNYLRFLYHFCLSELWPSKQFLFSSKKTWKAGKKY